MKSPILDGSSYWFDEQADDACEFFCRDLRLIEDEWAGQPFDLLPWQAEIVRDSRRRAK